MNLPLWSRYSITSSAATSRPGGTSKAERSSRLQIDNKLELGRLRYRQVSGLFLLKDAANIDPDLAKRIGHVCSIAHQSASFGVVAIGIGRGNPVSCRQSGKLHASAVEEKVGGDEQRFGTLARHRGESRIDLAAVARVEDLDFQPENVCRFLHLSHSGLGAHNVARVDHHGDANGCGD